MPYASERLQAQVSLPNRWQKERGEARHRLTEHQHGHETRQHKMEPSLHCPRLMSSLDTSLSLGDHKENE